uniref:Uncharacterized protein n=1 Tax=Ciona intestinalis TaxID=7719 RepID=H2XT28_CIOIN
FFKSKSLKFVLNEEEICCGGTTLVDVAHGSDDGAGGFPKTEKGSWLSWVVRGLEFVAVEEKGSKWEFPKTDGVWSTERDWLKGIRGGGITDWLVWSHEKGSSSNKNPLL